MSLVETLARFGVSELSPSEPASLTELLHPVETRHWPLSQDFYPLSMGSFRA